MTTRMGIGSHWTWSATAACWLRRSCFWPKKSAWSVLTGRIAGSGCWCGSRAHSGWACLAQSPWSRRETYLCVVEEAIAFAGLSLLLSVVMMGFNCSPFLRFLFALPLLAALATCFAFCMACCLIWVPFMLESRMGSRAAAEPEFRRGWSVALTKAAANRCRAPEESGGAGTAQRDTDARRSVHSERVLETGSRRGL